MSDLVPGTLVQVYAEGCPTRGTVEASWRSATGEPIAYHVSFHDGGLAWVAAAALIDISAYADRPAACFSPFWSRA